MPEVSFDETNQKIIENKESLTLKLEKDLKIIERMSLDSETKDSMKKERTNVYFLELKLINKELNIINDKYSSLDISISNSKKVHQSFQKLGSIHTGQISSENALEIYSLLDFTSRFIIYNNKKIDDHIHISANARASATFSKLRELEDPLSECFNKSTIPWDLVFYLSNEIIKVLTIYNCILSNKDLCNEIFFNNTDLIISEIDLSKLEESLK